MEPITVDQLMKAIGDNNIRRFILRDCSFCHRDLYYIFDGDRVFFSSACDCVTYDSPPRRANMRDVLNAFNIQEPDIRARMWAKFCASGSNASSAS